MEDLWVWIWLITKNINMINYEFHTFYFLTYCDNYWYVLVEAISTKHGGDSEFTLIFVDIINLMLFYVNFEIKFVER
jgi:hypothetical protein